MRLIEALEKQINFCKSLDWYKCGVFVKYGKDIKYVSDQVREMVHEDDCVEKMIGRSGMTEIYFKNGSYIKVLPATDNARGRRWNGVIIDSEIDKEIQDCIIYPKIIPRYLDKEFEPFEETKKRILYW